MLIVDDNVVNRRIFHEQLTRWGMQPVAVDSGRAALDALADAKSAGRPFALVLLDANMPDLDGFAVAEEIGRRPELADATIMMLTSSGEYGDTSRCRELGIAAYLVKPVRQLDLAEAIARAMSAPAVVPAAPNVVPLPVVQRSFRRMRVLLAEDNIVNQRVAVRLLTKRGHQVTVANNGREALEAIERTAFDVVLMDVQMPEMGGIEATAVVRDRERALGGRLRIVAMTAHALKGDRERCFAAGMDGYLSKPIDRLQLFDAVELAPSHGEAPIPPASFSGFNHGDFSERLGGDPQLVAEVVRVFLDDCPRLLRNVQAAIDGSNAEQLRQSAHELKGAAGNFGATAVVDAAQALEILGRHAALDAAPAAWRRLESETNQLQDVLRHALSESTSCAS